MLNEVTRLTKGDFSKFKEKKYQVERVRFFCLIPKQNIKKAIKKYKLTSKRLALRPVSEKKSNFIE